jgi:hypothetical protein
MRCRASELAIGLTWYDNDAMAVLTLLQLRAASPVKKFLEDYKAWL